MGRSVAADMHPFAIFSTQIKKKLIPLVKTWRSDLDEKQGVVFRIRAKKLAAIT